MKPFTLLSIIISCQLPACTLSRSWTEIDPQHGFSVVDWNGLAAQSEEDPFSIPEPPTESPTFANSLAAQSEENPSSIPEPPTESPTFMPTVLPSPSSRPSERRTGLPTSSSTNTSSLPPTAAPVNPGPASRAYPQIPPPQYPDEGYFNYDHRITNKYGPGRPQLVHYNSTYFQYAYPGNGWTKVSTTVYNYWNEFGNSGFGPWQGELEEYSPLQNKCDKVGNQSPIDLRVTDGSICYEGHEIRGRTGDLRLSDNQEIQKLIEGNKLRLLYQRRPCSDLANSECSEPDPPLADFPHNWPGLVDMLHIDLKVPSEHTINGKRFDGEMQMFYFHPARHRTPAVSVMMQVTESAFNIELQKALDQFQITYDKDMVSCENFQMNITKIPQGQSRNSTGLGRRLESDGRVDVLPGTDLAESGLSFEGRILQGNTTNQANKTNEVALPTEAPTKEQVADDTEALTEARVAEPTEGPAEAPINQGNETITLVNETIRTLWDPHHPLLIPGIYFYGYEGSLTEPPCSEFVSWKIMDTPMKISYEQLEQMKTLIFTHKSPECKFTSRHYNESVARPIQDTSDRPVWHCTSDDFAPDR